MEPEELPQPPPLHPRVELQSTDALPRSPPHCCCSLPPTSASRHVPSPSRDHSLTLSRFQRPRKRCDTAKPCLKTASNSSAPTNLEKAQELQALPRPCFSRPGDHTTSRTAVVGDEGGEDMLTCLLKGSWRPIIHLTVPFNHCLPGPYLNGCPRGVRLARALPNSQAI